MKRILVASVVALVLVTAALAYVRVGWWRMAEACSLSSAEGPIAQSVSYSWTWEPFGFTCTYDDGTTTTSLWP